MPESTPGRAWLATATPPTPNGDLHLGHLSGPYLALDVFSRHLRRCGVDVVAMTGVDDHQSYTALRANADGCTPAETALHFGDRIVEAWRAFGVAFDVVGRPNRSREHHELTQEIFRALVARGDIVPRVRPLPYCTGCERWAFEAYVTGGCPHCGASSGGNACEVCGRPNDCADLVDPRCTRCHGPCDLRDCERLYLPLAPHLDRLRALWDRVAMNGHLTALCAEMVADGLPEIAVSHPDDWGIPVPVDGFTDQRIYVWFEMAAGYLAAGDGVWSGGRRVVQFFGFDNGWFHAVLFPVVMAAYDPRVPLPTAFLCNEFYRLDGAKFSTSRQHAIWMLDVLDSVHPDHLRLYLSWDRPATSGTNFTWARFQERLDGDLLPRWREWLIGLGRRCRLPAPPSRVSSSGCAVSTTSLYRDVEELRERTRHTMATVGRAYGLSDFSPRAALRSLDDLVQFAAETGNDREHAAGEPGLHDAFTAGVDAELVAAAVLATGLYPIAPEMAQQLWTALGASTRLDAQMWRGEGPDCVDVKELAVDPLLAGGLWLSTTRTGR